LRLCEKLFFSPAAFADFPPIASPAPTLYNHLIARARRRSVTTHALDLTLFALGLIAAHAAAADPVTADQLADLQKVIRPSAGEDRWATIPWRIDLWEARKEAGRTANPSCSGRWTATRWAVPETTDRGP